MSGENYCGLTIKWNYRDRYVDISMPKYVPTALQKFQPKQQISPQHAPHRWTPPNYGQRIQYAKSPDTEPVLNKTETTYIQSVTGDFLYYARAVDPTMLPALNDIAASQAHPTKDTLSKVHMLKDAAATHPDATIRVHASAMILHIDSDAAYLVLPKARSRIAGHYFLSSHPSRAPCSSHSATEWVNSHRVQISPKCGRLSCRS